MSDTTPYTMVPDGDLNGYRVFVYDHGPVTPTEFWFTDRTSALEWLETRGQEIYGEMVRVESVQKKGAA